MISYPGPEATRAEIDAFLKEHAPPPEPPHEAPEIQGGPQLVCNACGVVRVGLFSPFCKGCKEQIQAATGEVMP